MPAAGEAPRTAPVSAAVAAAETAGSERRRRMGTPWVGGGDAAGRQRYGASGFTVRPSTASSRGDDRRLRDVRPAVPPRRARERRRAPRTLRSTAPVGRASGSVAEALHQLLQVAGHAGQFLGRLPGLRDTGRGGGRGVRDTVDAAGDLAAAGGGLADAAVHLRGGRPLLLHRRGDGQLEVVDLADDRRDAGDGRRRAGGVGLDGLDPAGDVLGGPSGLLGPLLYLLWGPP